jgi:hypothetical protein
MAGMRQWAKAAVFLLAAACAKIDNDPAEWTYDGPVNACGAAVDCGTGDCDAELGACVVSPPAGDALLARVVPDPATGTQAQVFPVTVAGGTISGALSVKVPVTVTGDTLIINEDDVTTPLIGRVVFSDVGNRLPGHPAQITIYEAYNSAVFDLALLPSTYDIIVVPEDAQAIYVPVYYLDDVALDVTGVFRDSGGNPVDVIVPLAAATVKGQIRLADAPVDGLEVVAFDPVTGRIVSTVGETDEDDCEESECFLFRIGLARSVVEAGTQFSLRASRLNEPHHPVFEADGFAPPAAGEELDLVGDARLALGALGVPVRFQATVLQPVRTQTGAEAYDTAPSCFVAFSSADVAGGSVEKWVLTNESGELEETSGVTGVNLYQGDYMITVIPAYAPVGSTSDYAVYTSTVPQAIYEDNGSGDVELLLSRRPLVTGMVSAGGVAVPTSAISAEPTGGAPDTARSNSSMSGGSGSFRFWLDAAPYVVVAEAPAESRYAWDFVEATVPDQALALSLELPLPFALRGAVAASAEQVNPIDVAGSVIDWYREIDGRAYAVGRCVADEAGGFVALLPP